MTDLRVGFGASEGPHLLSLLDLARTPLTPAPLLQWAGATGVLPPLEAEALRRLCASAEQDSTLTAMGRFGLADRIVTALKTRVALEGRAEAPAPEQPPICILGMPRSGSTLLHRAMSAHPSLRALRTWEVTLPLALGRRDDRRATIADRLRRLARLAPDLAESHALDPDAPEECVHLLEPTLCSPTFWHFFPVPSYMDWLAKADLRPAYAVYARLLHHLAAAEPSRRLILKGPAHALFVDALLEAVPGIELVWLHRDPAAVLPSVNTLHARAHGPLSEHHDPARTAALNRELLLAQLDADKLDAHHLRFTDVIADLPGTVNTLLAHLGLPTMTVPPLPRRPPAPHPPATLDDPRVTAYRERRL